MWAVDDSQMRDETGRGGGEPWSLRPYERWAPNRKLPIQNLSTCWHTLRAPTVNAHTRPAVVLAPTQLVVHCFVVSRCAPCVCAFDF